MRLLAYIGVQTEVLDDAEVLLENAVRFEPDNDLARFDYMGVLYKRQKYAASFAQAEQLIEKRPRMYVIKPLMPINVSPSADLMRPSRSTIR